MRKVLFGLLSILLLAGFALGADYSVARLTADAQVSKDGKVRVEQEISLEITAPVREITLPVGESVQSVRVSAPGAEVSTYTQNSNTYATLSFKEGFSGELPVSLHFTARGKVTATDKGQAFSCTLVSGLWETKIQRFSFSLSMPGDLRQEPVFLSGYRGQDVADSLTTAVEGTAVSGLLRGGLLDREDFTMTATVPAGTFQLGGNVAVTRPLFWICLVLTVLLMGLGIYYWFRFLRTKRLRVQARTTPPESLSPGEIRHILCGGHISFGLLVCYWGVLGYLTIAVNSAGRILLRKCMDMGTERREEERKLFMVLFGTSDVCEACGSRYERAADLAEKAFPRHWFRRLYERNTGSVRVLQLIAALCTAFTTLASMDVIAPAAPFRWLMLTTSFVAGFVMGAAIMAGIRRTAVRDYLCMLAGLACVVVLYILNSSAGLLLLGLASLLFTVFVALATRYGGKKTPSGTDFVERTLGYARFLRHADSGHLSQMLQRDPQYFYCAMLYATGCGEGRQFAQRFGDSRLEDCPWLSFTGRTPGRAYPYYLRFESLLKKMDG